MKVNQLKELIRQVVREENDYQELFKTMLSKTGKDINSMSDDEKKKFDEEKKKYELDEQRCKVGKIEVTNGAGTVELDRAFEGTYVASSTQPPTPPVVMNITEGKISNNLIIVKPQEIQRAIAAANKSKKAWRPTIARWACPHQIGTTWLAGRKTKQSY